MIDFLAYVLTPHVGIGGNALLAGLVYLVVNGG